MKHSYLLKKSLILLATIPALQSFSAAAESRLCWYEPATATQNEQITVYYNAAEGSKGLKDFTGEVYTHCGVITQNSTSDSDWKHTPSHWCDNNEKYLMTRSADDPNIYTLTMTPSTYFGLAEGEVIDKLAFVMRNSNGSKEGKTASGGDIIVDFINRTTPSSDKALGKLISYTDDGTTVTVTSEHGTVAVTPYNDYVIKVYPKLSSAVADQRRSIAVCATPQCDYSTTDTDDDLIISTSSLKVTISKADSKITFTDSKGATTISEDPSSELINSDGSRGFRFINNGDAAFYGGGYNGRVTNNSGRTITIDNIQNYGWDRNSKSDYANNICIPFIVSTSGYGLLFDDHYRRAKITPSAAATQYTTGSQTPVAYYYVGGDGSMASVLENYTFLTGRQELPPYWALGYITSRYGYRSRAEAESVISSIKSARLPLDGIVFDLYWQGDNECYMGNLDWDLGNWPNPSEMMDNFKRQGVNTICITEPFFTSRSKNYSTLQQKGYLADDNVSNMSWLNSPQVGLIDATNPDALDWFWDFYRKRTLEGMGGWWLDLGEPEQHDGDSRHLGGSVDEVHNEFGNLWIERVYRGYKEEFADVRPFLMPRAGAAGMQRYSTFPWTGDINRSWAGLQAQIPALVSAGMSGVGYMGSDVGGFVAQGTDANLYLRWVEMATFSPMMRTHSTNQPEPYNSCYSSVLPDVRKFINMRYSYLPYTYTLAWENATKGTPLARPVNFHSADPAELSDCNTQYLWGRDILVAPVLEYATSRSISFPEGEWVDLNNLSDTYSGGSTINYQAPHGCLPHFGRKGSFITRFSSDTYTNTGDIDGSRLTVTYLTSPNTETRASIFDDDKTSASSLAEGDYIVTNLTGTASGDDHIIDIAHEGKGYPGMPESRLYTFVIPGYDKAIDHIEHITNAVARGTDKMPQAADKAQFDRIDGDCYLLDNDKTLYIKANMSSRDPERIFVASTITSGVDQIGSAQMMSLSYGASTAMLSYSVPAGWTGASISVVNLTGVTLRQFDGLNADGTISQIQLDGLGTGIYIATLSAADSNGNPVKRTVKISAIR